MIHDENEYFTVRSQLLTPATPGEHTRAARIATQIDKTKSTTFIDPLVKLRLNKTQQYLDDTYPMITHYTYEDHFAHYKSTIHKIWNDSFGKTDIITTKLIVGTRNNRNLKRELLRRTQYVKSSRIIQRQTRSNESIKTFHHERHI